MRFAGAIKTEEFTLPSGEGTVLFRPLTAGEANDIGVIRLDNKTVTLTGAQMRAVICRVARDPKFVDDESPQNGAISIYALSAQDELALMNHILQVSFQGLGATREIVPDPFPGDTEGRGELPPDALPSGDPPTP